MYMLKKIQETVAQHYGVRVVEILSSTRDAKVAEARQVAMYVARKYTTKSLPEIAYAFGKRHATVIHAVKAIEKRIANEVNLKEVIEGLCGQLVAKDVPHDEGTDSRWRRIQAFLQEVGVVNNYLHWRVLCKRYGEQPGSPLFRMTADLEGELSEELIVKQLEAIARQARAGFVPGEGFPLFGSFEK